MQAQETVTRANDCLIKVRTFHFKFQNPTRPDSQLSISIISTLSVPNQPVRNQDKTPFLHQIITIGLFTQQNIANMPSEAQVIGGHKANIHNPNTSAEAKEHSKDVLKEDFNGKN